MKRFLIFIFVLVSLNAFSQGGIQKVNGYGFHYNRHYADTLQGLPRDTFAVPAALKSLAWIAAKNELLYFWSSSLNKWIQAAGGTGGGVYSAGLFLSLSANRFAFDTTAFKNWLRTDSIYVVTPLKVKDGSVMDTLYQNVVSSTDSGYVTPVMKGKWDTAYLKQPISGSYASGTITVTVKDGSTWTIPGLPTGGGGSGVSEFRNLTDVNLSATYGSLGDSRVAIYDSATQKWKDQAAARFNLTSPVLDSSILIYDSVNREWVNAPYPVGTGSAGDLQAVTDIGATTTHEVTVNGLVSPYFTTSDSKIVLNTPGGVGTLELANSGDFAHYIEPQAASVGGTFYLPNTGNTIDTLATLSDVRAGGGGGTTPDLQAVTDQGNVTNNAIVTTSILQSRSDAGVEVVNPSSFQIRAQLGKSSDNGFLFLGNTGGDAATLKADDLTSNITFQFPNTGNAIDTLATLSDVRAGGGGGGSTPDLQAVTDVGNTTTNRLTSSGGLTAYDGDLSTSYAGFFSVAGGQTAKTESISSTNGDGAWVHVFHSNTANAGGYIRLRTTTGDGNYAHWLDINHNYIQIQNTGSGATILKLTNLPVYDSESAATTGGLTTDTVYRTSTGELRIKL